MEPSLSATSTACETILAAARSDLETYYNWLDTSGYTEQAARARRSWQRRWILKASLFVAAVSLLIYGYAHDISEITGWGMGALLLSFVVPGKFRGKPPHSHADRLILGFGIGLRSPGPASR